MIVNPKTTMSAYTTLIQRDLQHVWHPCSYMNDFHTTPPLVVEGAAGSYIYTNQGTLIDAISSWWCKSLGHGHPAVTLAIKQQLNKFEHVISANTTHPLIIELAEKLASISGKQHVFFASDGSSAVEIALKLALQATQIKGQTHRQKIISLNNAYHGETIATLSVSNLDLYNAPFRDFGLKNNALGPIPYVTSTNDPQFFNCEAAWVDILPQLLKLKDEACAIIVEPIVQGAGGMLCYSADFLSRLAQFAKENDLYLIADEIMTGIGRTGKWLASNHANVKADLVCLSKGLTSGALPLSCVLIDNNIYQLFGQDASSSHTFLHSHTYSGNALAISAALATLHTIENEAIIEQVQSLGEYMHKSFANIANQSQKLHNVRSIGAIVAADLTPTNLTRIGHRVANAAQSHGALLRPIGNTIYWLPPLNTTNATIDSLTEITFNAIQDAYNHD